MSRKTRAWERERKEWMREYIHLLISADLASPRLVDWDLAYFYYCQGITPEAAVEKQRDKEATP